MRPSWVDTYNAAQPSQPPLVICDGNSLTAAATYPNRLLTLLGGTWVLQNPAVGGVDTPNRIAAENTNIISKCDLRRSKQIAVLWEATNDIYWWLIGGGGSGTTTSLQDVMDHYQAYCQNARNANFKVVAVTIMPRSNSPMTAPQITNFYAQYQAFNTWLRANWQNFADALVDVAADSRFGTPGCETNVTYFSGDNVHLNATGYNLIADMVYAVASTL